MRRHLVFVLASCLVLISGVSAVGQASDAHASATASATPTPMPTPCVTSQQLTASPSEIEPGDTVTVTIRYQTFKCSTYQERDTPIYARAEGETEFRQIGTLHTAAEQDASASLTTQPMVTTTYAANNSGNGGNTVTVRGSTSSPEPTQTPHADRACPTYKLTRPTAPINVGETTTVTATVADGEQPAQFSLTRSAPGPLAIVRSTEGHVRTVTWTLRLGETHRFAVVASRGDSCIGGGTGATDFTIPVRPSLTIAATRNAARAYTFTGRVLPGRGQLVTLYRHDGQRRVITAQSRVQPNGTYRIDRRFTGSGRFGFSVAVSTSSTNLAGSSAVRPHRHSLAHDGGARAGGRIGDALSASTG